MVTSVEYLALLAWLTGRSPGQSLTEYKGCAAREYRNEIPGNYFCIVRNILEILRHGLAECALGQSNNFDNNVVSFG